MKGVVLQIVYIQINFNQIQVTSFCASKKKLSYKMLSSVFTGGLLCVLERLEAELGAQLVGVVHGQALLRAGRRRRLRALRRERRALRTALPGGGTQHYCT